MAKKAKPKWSWPLVSIASIIHFIVSCVIIARAISDAPEIPLSRALLLPLDVVAEYTVPGMQEAPGLELILLLVLGVPINSIIYGLFVAAVVFALRRVWR